MDSGVAFEDRRRGAILGVVLVVVGLVSFIGMGLLELAARDAEEASKALLNARAFWMAEAGVQRITKRLFDQLNGDVGNQTLGRGSYQVWLYDAADPPYAIARGRAGGVERYIRVNLAYLADPYEEAVFGAGESSKEWVLDLRGTGDPNHKDVGGRDIINGNVFVGGDFFMAGESEVNAAPPPNTYSLNGDVEAVGSITIGPDASVDGNQMPGATPRTAPDLRAMDYANNNSYSINQIFDDLGIFSGHLPVGHPLRDVVVKNPVNRGAECASTPGDDFFFEPVNINSSGGSKDARTPLDLGDGKIYYVDGDAWFHSYNTWGFKVEGQATIVTTGDMHISDNIKYKDSSSLLGLVALGEYDLLGNLDRGGDIYFGDPQFGTLFTVDAFMFAGNDFLYNTRVNGGGQAEPVSGFEVFGNFAAVNRVVVNRDWYKPEGQAGGVRRPAVYQHATGEWVDFHDPTRILTAAEIADMKHYQMKVTYDERIWKSATQPPGLPRGEGTIYGGMTGWQEINAGDV
jgi:hypothetical protein